MEPTQPQPPTPTEPGTQQPLPQPVQNAVDAARSALQQAQQHLDTIVQQVSQHL